MFGNGWDFRPYLLLNDSFPYDGLEESSLCLLPAVELLHENSPSCKAEVVGPLVRKAAPGRRTLAKDGTIV